MKKIINAPENYVDEMLEGIYAAHPDKVKCAADDLLRFFGIKRPFVKIRGWLTEAHATDA